MSTAVAYLRISEDPRDRRLGVERQHHDMRTLADRLETNLERIFEDNDVTASKVRKQESAWFQCLQTVEHQRPDYLLCFTQDRLGRRLADIEGLEELCAKTGTKVVAFEGGEVFKNAAWPVLAAVAKMETRATSMRVKAANRVRREKGLPPAGGRRAFGFEQDRVTLRASEVSVLRELAERAIHGESLYQLTRWLQDTGVPTVNGGQWRTTTLRQILQNPRYSGDLAVSREGGYRVVGKGSWEPVFERETWDALQAALAERQNHTSGRPRTASLLGGIARCGKCLHSMVSHSSNKRADGTYLSYYRCNRADGGCAKVLVRREALDEFVMGWVLERPELFEPVDTNDLDNRIKKLRRERLSLELRIEDAQWAFREGRVSADVLPLIDDMFADRRALDRRIGEATRDRDRSLAATPMERFRTASLAERRKWLQDHGLTVMVEPGGKAEVHRGTVRKRA